MKKPIEYSLLNPEVVNTASRLAIAKQIHSVLKTHLKAGSLKNFRVLDIGCSGGIITNYFSGYVKEIIGIDNDKNAISWGKKMFNAKNLKLLPMDAAKILFPNNSFDLIICNQVYVDLKKPEQLFSEVHRVLKKGGVCFFGAVNKYQLWENQYKLPFISFLPVGISRGLLKFFGRKEDFILGSYRSYWELLNYCEGFKVYRYTPKILKNPGKYKFAKLAKWQSAFSLLPTPVWQFLEPLSPNFIWILEKP